MNEIGPQQILDQIRALNKELHAPVIRPSASEDGSGFGNELKNVIDSVNETQQTAGRMTRDFEMGTSDADLAAVMVAVQKADLSFRAMTEVRNKLVNAYQEIMNMPV